MKRILTLMSKLTTMLLAGETEAGSVEVQPARDSRFKATNWEPLSLGWWFTAIPFYEFL